MRKTAIYLILLFTIISHSSFSNSNSIKFINAKNNGIRISQNSSLNLSSQGTIEAWIYLSSYKDFAGIIHKGDKKDFSDEAYTLQLWNNNKLYFAISNNSNSYQIQSTSSLQLSKWYHVSASWNSSGMQLYLNGKLESTSSNSLTINYANLNDPNKNGLNIGRQLNEDYNTSYNKFTFDGIIDEVRIWNSCLHIYQIQKRMFEELNSSDSLWSNLVGYWPFNEGSGTVVSDNSSNSNTGNFIPSNGNKPRWKTRLFPNSLTWKGDVSRDWNNANNWQEGITPHAFSNVLIPTTTTNLPEVKNTGMQCGSLILNPGKYLTIASGKSLKVWSEIVFKTDNTKTASLVNLGTLAVVGESRFERKITSDGWHYISSPVSNSSSNIFWGSALYGYNETSGLWNKVTNNQTLNSMDGYDVYVKNNHKVVTYTGSLNSGNFSKNLTYNRDGYNLIGNPYPATIDWDASSGWTKTNINGAIYIWDPAQNNFTTYTNGSGTNGGSRYIASTQGFFVRANSGGGSIAMTPQVMVEYPNGQFRGDKNAYQLSLIVDGNGRNDETIIRFHENAQEYFEDNLDAYKIYSYDSDVPQIYSVLTDGSFASINSLPKNNMDVSIPISFIASVNSEYQINCKLDKSPVETDFFLEDLVTNEIFDLKQGTYHFHGKVTDSKERFLLHVNHTATLVENENTSTEINENNMRSINVFSTHRTLFIDTRSAETNLATIKVYNMLGEQVSQKQIQNQDIHSFSMDCSAGYYFVEISTIVGNEVFKVFIN